MKPIRPLVAAAALGGALLIALPDGAQPPTVPDLAPLETSDGRWPAEALLPEPPETVHRHVIEAAYDPETRQIEGSMRLSWKNTTSAPVLNLCFHHYLNAFSSNRSTFFKESGGQLRGDRFEGDEWGWIEVESLRLADGEDLTSSETFVAPDDGNPHDRTVALYDLPRAIAPGEAVDVDVTFTSQLPSIFARTGAHGNYVLGAQWYPKIAVFEDAGEGVGDGRKTAGWNCHQFHAHSEFFADFGDYDVSLTLPAEYAGKIGATGAKVAEETAPSEKGEMGEMGENGETVTARFVQQGVHDFAWTADPDFLVIEDRFDPDTDVPPEQRRRIAAELGVPESELALSPVDLTLFLQPSHAGHAERYLRSAKEGIRGYGLRLGAYPYRTLTMVDPAVGAEGSGGMEYPTFITLGTSALLGVWPFDEALFPEQVTIHEFGHQYFQGMSASNEFEESWLDEGLNSYIEMLVMDDEYDAVVDFLGMRLTSREMHRLAVTSGPHDPVATPAWRFMSSGSYGANSYSRTATLLRHLDGILAPGELARAMRDFFQEYRFDHPTTRDFEQAVERSTGRDLGWFFDQALHSTRQLDYSIRRVRSVEADDDDGVFWNDDGRYEVGGEDTEDTDAESEPAADDDETLWRSEVLAYREGEFIHPVTVEFRFEDGSSMRREWAGDRRWRRWTFTTTERLVSAEVDPDDVLALDANRLNNSRRIQADSLPRRKLMTDALFWFQTLLGTAHGVFS